jgi:hypothetical protein
MTGANKPNYKRVDIRKTQDISYGKHEYVTSDLNPGIVFHGPKSNSILDRILLSADLSVPKNAFTKTK